MSREKFITIPTLEKWQHYKDRCPPWIKLHRDVLNDYKFSRLQDASKAHLLSIWLLASQMDNKIPYDEKWIAQRINATCKIDFKGLLSSGMIEFFKDGSDVLADCKQNDIAETETETETETEDKPEFDDFYIHYPKKKSRGKAEIAWNKIKPDSLLLEKMIASLSQLKKTDDWTKDNGQFIPHPATWLNAKGWEDEIETGGQSEWI